MIVLYLDNEREIMWDISMDGFIENYKDANYDHLHFSREPNHDESQKAIVIIRKDFVNMVEEIIE